MSPCLRFSVQWLRRWLWVPVFSLLFCGCQQSQSPENAPQVDGEQAGAASNATAQASDMRSQRGVSPLAQGLMDDLDSLVPSSSQKNSGLGPDSHSSRILFSDVHVEAGIDFVMDNGASSKKLMTEAVIGGAGWFDYDRDGWPDLYFAQGGDPSFEKWEGQPVDQLYRNIQSGRFLNVTEHTALVDFACGNGVCIGDFNNDGFDDIYVTNVGHDALYQNMGDGTFEEIAIQSGISNPLWGSSAAWGDLDLDGNLDLYVCNYVDYDPKNPIACFDSKGKAGTCHPNNVDPIMNKVFMNNGDGTFREESDKRGLNGPGSKSLGVVIADLNGDHLPDVYVANDTTPNHLFVNQGEGRFSEQGVVLGCAMSHMGDSQASMGIAFGDYDRNGWPDLYLSHFTKDSNTLYQNLGPAGFTDRTREIGLHLPTLDYLAFGTVMSDFDLNGWQDLFMTNGHIDDWRETSGDDWKMRSQMFEYNGERWYEVSHTAGPYFQKIFLGRGVATADYDLDGDLDLLVVNQNDSVGLLRNDSQTGHWLRMRLVGQQSNRNGIGAVVTVEQESLKLVSQLPGGTSYASSQEMILSFGFGESTIPCRVSIRWPSGREQFLEGISIDQQLTLFERDAEAF